MIPGSATPLLLAQSGEDSYKIDRSLRFNSGDSAYLNRTPSSAGNRKTWTWSCWVKRTVLGADKFIFSAGSDASNMHYLRFTSNDTLEATEKIGDSVQLSLITSAVYRDVSAWMHIIYVYDSSQATAADRLSLYVNGVEITAFGTSTYPSQNHDSYINSTSNHFINARPNPAGYADQYLADVHFTDGQALAATDFGRFDDNGVWQPKEYSGTYGTNGFHLDFSDNSSTTALGYDANRTYSVGNSGPWTSGFSSGTVSSGDTHDTSGNSNTLSIDTAALGAYDITITKTGGANAIHLSTSDTNTGWTLLENNLTTFRITNTGTPSHNFSRWVLIQGSGGGYVTVSFTGTANGPLTGNDWTVGNLSVASGAGNDSLIDTPTNYEADSGNNGGNYATWNPLQKYAAFTLSNGNLDFTDNNTVGGGDQGVHATIAPVSGKFYWEMTLSTLASENYIGISKSDKLTQIVWTGGAVDGYYYYNNGNKIGGGNGNGGQSYGASFGVGDVIGVAVDWDNGKVTFYKNGASQGDAFTGKDLTGYIPAYYFNTNQSSAGVVNFGQRPFAYTPPTGYVSLCTTNLPDPTIADGSTAFGALTYSGNGSARTLTGLNMNPDFIWIKSRSSVQKHVLVDSVRTTSTGEYLASDSTQAEGTGVHISGTTDGITIADPNASTIWYNDSSHTYVAWAWDAGTSTASNTDGSITSSVRASASNGFSVVSWSGTSANATVGHGLNAAPEFIITKVRGMTSNWYCYHTGLTDATKYIWLNSPNAEGTQTAAWNSTDPTSSVIHVGGEAEVNRNGYNTIAYCFAPIEGYSAFGLYEGNGSNTDGPFVYCGFRPKFFMLKSYTNSRNWHIFDSERSPVNVVNDALRPNINNAEVTNYATANLLFNSNGVKVNSSWANLNAAGNGFIYAAFAEHPFKTARAR